MPSGRPSSYTEVVADEICRRLASGESLIRICQGSDMPDRVTVYRWLANNDAFRNKYAQAREDQADTKFEEAWEIASGASSENVQVARLQIDTIKWQTARLAPRKYGDRIEQVHSGQIDLRSWLTGAE